MGFRIEKIKDADLPMVLKLLREFAAFEDLTEYCEINEEKLRDAMFGLGAFVEGLLAFADKVPIGYALFYPNFSSFRGELGLHLEDIYITENFRGKGVGKFMLTELTKLAKTRGLQRIDFQVLEWNTPAVNFYRNLGAESVTHERHFKFSIGDLDKLLL